MTVIIRSATENDHHAIKAIIRAARINPMNLDWPRFLVAQWNNDIIGVGQIKPHGDGSREVASIAVVPEWQGQGVGSRLVQSLLARERGVLHLVCLPAMEGYYTRFGFSRIARVEMPCYFRRIERIARIFELLTFKKVQRVIVMRRVPPHAHQCDAFDD